jgi:hypothetical protein
MPIFDDTKLLAIRHSLWRRGQLDWKLRVHQLPIYKFIAHGGLEVRPKPATKTLLNISRQTGKSFVAVLYAIEHCLTTKHAHVQFLASTGKQMRSILVPAFKKIIDDCPEDIAPVATASDGSWTFPTTGAVLRFDGVDNDNAENLRGRSSTLVIIDEAGFIDDLEYLVKDIIQPQFIVTKGRMVLISTPPETPDHYFKTLCDDAKLDDAYLERDVYLNGFAESEDIEKWMKEAGGEKSSTWRREYLCQFLVDEARQVIPEFTEERAQRLIQPVPPAGENHCVVGMDVGFRDATGVLFGYYDFRGAKLVIEREMLIRGKDVRTDTLAATIKFIEAAIWGKEPTFRVSDVELILLNDLQSIHNLSFRPATKDNKDAMVNELRLWIQQDRIIIDKSCVKLARQLQNAIWNRERKQFERDADGHYDLVDALIYLVRTLPSVIPLNPHTRLDPTIQPVTHWISNVKKQTDPDVLAMEQLFSAPTEDDEWVELDQLFR